MDLLRLLDAFEWFRRLPPAARDTVLRTTQLRHAEESAFVAHREFATTQWIGVCSGLLKASASSADGRPCSELLASTGEWTGEAEILLDRRRSYDIVALESSTLVLVSAQTFRWLVGSDIAFANFVIRLMATRSAAAMDRFERPRHPAGVAAVAKSVAGLLVRVMRSDSDPPMPVVRLSQSEIAEMVRLSRQTVNQSLRLLEGLGIVRLGYNKVEIRNEEALRRICAF